MAPWETLATIALAGALCAGCCVALARAFFRHVADDVAWRMAGAWTAAFAVGLVAGLAAHAASGPQAALLVEAGACAAAFACLPLLARRWRQRGMAAALAYLQLHRAALASPAAGGAPSGACPPAADNASGLGHVGGAGTPACHASFAGFRASGSPSDASPAPVDSAAGADSAAWASSVECTCARAARRFDLTRREEDVLALLADGLSPAEVAEALVVSPNTVKSHVRHVYAKMGVRGRRDLLEKLRG